MSANFNGNVAILTPDIVNYLDREPVQDVFIAFEGWGPGNPMGKKITKAGLASPNLSFSGTFDAAYWKEYTTQHKPLQWEMWTGDPRSELESRPCVTEAAKVIMENFDPRGRIAILGTSAGGPSALELCRKFRNMYFEFNPHPSPLGKLTTIDPRVSPAPLMAKVRIDYLFTADAAYSVRRDIRDKQRVVADSVDWNYDFYQTVNNTKETDPAKLIELDKSDQEADFHDATTEEDKNLTTLVPRKLEFKETSGIGFHAAATSFARKFAGDTLKGVLREQTRSQLAAWIWHGKWRIAQAGK
jgi:hypothetical protein